MGYSSKKQSSSVNEVYQSNQQSVESDSQSTNEEVYSTSPSTTMDPPLEVMYPNWEPVMIYHRFTPAATSTDTGISASTVTGPTLSRGLDESDRL